MIDDETLHALKIEVERLVRPIRATRRRKDRMREELWSHLAGRAEQYFNGEHDPQFTARQSVALLGDRQMLTRELQACVPLAERILWTPLREPRWLEPLGRRLWGLADLDAPWHGRSALGWTAATAVGICLLFNPLLHWGFDRNPDWHRLLNYGATFCVLALATQAALLPFASGLYRRWLGDANAEPGARLAARGALLAAVLLAAGPAFAFQASATYTFDWADAAEWLALSLAAPPAWALLMRLAATERRHWREWESLIAEE